MWLGILKFVWCLVGGSFIFFIWVFDFSGIVGVLGIEKAKVGMFKFRDFFESELRRLYILLRFRNIRGVFRNVRILMNKWFFGFFWFEF